MKKSGIFIVFLLCVFFNVKAQSPIASTGEPQYLQENKATSFLSLYVDKNTEEYVIDIKSLRDVRNFTFYVLKGISYNDGRISWRIIATIESSSKKSIQKSITDKSTNEGLSLYRVMVLDDRQNIEYTPIISLHPNQEGNPDTGA